MKINIERTERVKDLLCKCNGICDTGEYFEDLQKLGQNLKVDEIYRNLEEFCMAIASKERLIILRALKEKDRCICELEAILDKSQSTISHHLRKLERANLIKSWKEKVGKKKGTYFAYYGLEKQQLNLYLEKLNEEFEI